jgi:hypothetical protein
MDTELLLNLRNLMLFSLVLSSGALFPEKSRNVSAILIEKWKQFKKQRLMRKNRKADKQRTSFWEIDMTKFEP